jgi:AraC-like DNA-binding protein
MYSISMKNALHPYEIRRLKEKQQSLIHFISDKPGPFMWHYHGYYEIIAVLEGPGRWLVGDRSGSIEPGQIFLTGPSLPHAYYHVGHKDALRKRWFKGIVIMFSLSPETIPEVSELSPLLGAAGNGVLLENAGDTPVFELIRKLSGQQGIRALATLLELLCELEASGRKQLIAPGYTNTGTRNTHQVNRLDAVFQYLHQHYRENVPLAEVARLVHMSVSGLCAFFKRSSRTTIHHYIHELRMEEACRLLLETQMPITEIASSVGYRTLSNFNRQFKTTRQFAPREFRKASR